MKMAILAVMYCMAAVCAETAEYLVVDLSGGPQAAKRTVRTSVTPPDIAKDDCRAGTKAPYYNGKRPSSHLSPYWNCFVHGIDRCCCKLK